jgi:hypothetical protein
MSKRKKFIITSTLLSLGFIAMLFVSDQYKIAAIAVLSLLTIPFIAWGLRGSLGFNMTLTVFILPLLFTFGVGFFWFLLPVSIFLAIPIVILFGIGIYSLSLTLNIYTVSAIRTIALLRAARGVGFVLTLLTFFLLFDTVLSLRWWVYWTGGIVFLISLPLYLQGFWSFDLEHTPTKKILSLSLISSIVMAEVSSSLFFWPVGVVVGSLFLTVTAYILLGLGQAELEGRLFVQTVREYLMVGFSVLIGMFLATHWK